VQKGEVLARLEQTSLPQSVILAQSDLVDAQEALDDLLNSRLAQANALIALEEAEQALEDLDNYDVNYSQAMKAVAEAQDSVDEAQRDVYISQSTAGQADIDAAYVQILLTLEALERAQKTFEPYENKPVDSLSRARYLSELSAAQGDYDEAVRNYNALTSTSDQSSQTLASAELAAAQAQLEENRRQLASLEGGPSAGEVALLEAQLADAQRAWERVKDGPDPDELAAAQAQVAAAQATINQAFIEAPFSGEITALETQPGDQVSSSTLAFRQDDLSRMLVDVQVSEIDITKVQNGQPVVVTFDALADQQYSGVVTEVSPVGEDQDGIAYFDVTVEVSEADESVLPGMTAIADIVVTQIAETLLVPNQAIRVEDNKQVVYVMRPGSGAQPVEIKLGASSDTYSQILEGEIQPGDMIVLSPASEITGEAGDRAMMFQMRRVEGGAGPGGGPPPGEEQP
jgi:HlyD family secretion protein